VVGFGSRAGLFYRVLVDGLAIVLLDAGAAERQRAAEGPAQIVALGQLSGVHCEQRTRSWKQLDIARIWLHRPNLHGSRMRPSRASARVTPDHVYRRSGMS